MRNILNLFESIVSHNSNIEIRFQNEFFRIIVNVSRYVTNDQ